MPLYIFAAEPQNKDRAKISFDIIPIDFISTHNRIENYGKEVQSVAVEVTKKPEKRSIYDEDEPEEKKVASPAKVGVWQSIGVLSCLNLQRCSGTDYFYRSKSVHQDRAN